MSRRARQLPDPGRRGLLGLGLSSAALALLGPAGRALAAFEGRAGGPIEVDPRFWKRLPGQKTQCFICPLDCVLEAGQTCFCRTRTNHDGELRCHAYGNPCTLSVDAIEKLPLNHFLPGEQTLSIAFGGCNLRCLYCQNWAQSQSKPDDLKTFDYPPERALEAVVKKQIGTIAYTYTEPVVFFEYVRDLSELARQRGVRNVCATAAFIEVEPVKELCRTIDAFCVALKGFSDKFYDKVCGSQLKPILRAIEAIRAAGPWLEIVNLVLPSYNDSQAEIKKLCHWVRLELGVRTPLHFARFTPEYRMRDLPPTPVKTLEQCREIARDEGLEHVYILNVSPHDANQTYCPRCGKVLIKRLGFDVLENQVQKGACPFCSSALPGVWA